MSAAELSVMKSKKKKKRKTMEEEGPTAAVKKSKKHKRQKVETVEDVSLDEKSIKKKKKKKNKKSTATEEPSSSLPDSTSLEVEEPQDAKQLTSAERNIGIPGMATPNLNMNHPRTIPKRPVQQRPVRVFLGNLPFKITEEGLRKVFKQCGEIDNFHFVKDKKTGKFYGTAFAEFVSPEAANLALGYNGKKVNGRPIKIGWATGGAHSSSASGKATAIKNAPLSEKPEDCRMVFLGNLPFSVEEEHVREFFEGCGDIVEVRWVMDGETFKGAGFVEFADTEHTDLAVTKNGERLLDRPIRVDYAPYREGRG